MNFNAWIVNLPTKSAEHISGVKVIVEGNLDCPSGIVPSGFSETMTALDQARLLRCGFNAIQQKFIEKGKLNV